MRESFDNGKYTVVFEEGGRLHALRYGEPWRDLCGDGMVLSMLYEVAELRQKYEDLERESNRWLQTELRLKAQLAAVEAERDAARDILSEVQHLCNKIVNSPPDATIKGEIESIAFMLGHYPLVLNAPQKEIQ